MGSTPPPAWRLSKNAETPFDKLRVSGKNPFTIESQPLRLSLSKPRFRENRHPPWSETLGARLHTHDVESTAAVSDSERMRRAQWLAEKEEEIGALQQLSVNEVVPSRRDFTMFVATQKRDIGVVPRLKRCDPDTGAAWPNVDFAALAALYDEAETAAVAVGTARLHGGSIEDLRLVAEATTAPVLRDDLCLHADQVYHARLYGADAVVLPASHLDLEQLRTLAAVANSVHMAAVIEVQSEDDLIRALGLAPACVGVNCMGRDGFTDLSAARSIGAKIPPQRTVLLLSEVPELESLSALEGLIDAAVVGKPLLDAGDPAMLIEAFVNG